MSTEQEEIARLREALEFYASAWKFKTNKRYGGLEWSPTEPLLDDCGNRAKEALAKPVASFPFPGKRFSPHSA